MIIVSQDKKMIINFNRISEITVDDNDVLITDDIYKSYGERIGKYETEERAKEVLQEIVELYLMKDLIIGDVGYNNVVNYPKVYEMPEE